jgi:hypothetical protein
LIGLLVAVAIGNLFGYSDLSSSSRARFSNSLSVYDSSARGARFSRVTCRRSIDLKR